jgi:hypothetical protein
LMSNNGKSPLTAAPSRLGCTSPKRQFWIG